ncbi:A-type flagellin [uncultured Clostridium sp.]|jgi:flagellin|nr:A-type flagellin [uncultured Clostridium sp.]
MSKNIVFSKNAGMKSQIFFQRGVKFPKSSPIYLTSKANKTFAYRTSSESKVSHAGETEDNGDEGNRMCELEADIAKANNGAQGSARQFKEEYIMVVQHNLTAMNSNRMLGITTKSQAKSTEKLSSGYKINRAADDAAGLSISEKMRKQIRGLTQASSNAQDGISAVQTAEGALNEVQDMLQRMNELAVKAANGTQSEDDRSYIQNEIDQLTTEIDRVAETTKFNETYLLKGDQDNEKAYTYSYATATGKAATATMSTTASTKGSKITTMTFKTTASADEQNEVAKLIRDQGINVQYSSKDSATTGKVVNSATVSLNGTDKYTVTNTTGNDYSIKDAKGNEIATFTLENANLGEKDKADAITPGTETFTASKATAGYKDGDTVKYYDKDGNGIPENALSKYFSSTTNAAGTVSSTVKADAPLVYDALGNKIDAAVADISAKQDLTGALTLTLHVGADATSNNQISVNLDAMSAKGLGVNGLKVDGTDDTNAKGSIETIKEAIQKVSTQRSALGAVQNRLEHTISNLDNVVENTTSAESQIRDTDMATEMVKYSNNNILAQAGQAMLAQSNQSNQGVLSLLQ